MIFFFNSKRINNSENEYIDLLRKFVSKWNQYTQSGKEPTEFMKEQFNTIQEFQGEPLIGITGEGFVGIKLIHRDSFVITLEELVGSSNSKKFCNLYERYLEAINKIELPSKRKGLAKGRGLNPLLIQIDNQKLNVKGEKCFIKNSRSSRRKLGVPQFNPWGYNYRIFLPKKYSTAFNLIHLLMEEVEIEKEIFREKMQEVRKKIPDSTGEYGKPTKIYKFKRSIKDTNEILSYILFRSIQGKRLSRCGEDINRLVTYHKCSGTRILKIIKRFRKLTNDLLFKLLYLNRSKALSDAIIEIKLELMKCGYYDGFSVDEIDIKNDKFWNYAKKELTLVKTAEIFQKAELANLHSLDIDYNIEQALKYTNEKISLNLDHFWCENFADSFTRLITIMIGDPMVRKKINEKTPIVLHPYVDTKETGHSHWSNIVTKPDSICFQKSSIEEIGKALESVQIKKLTKIGQNQGELDTIDYIMEILKTFTYWDKSEIPKTLRRLQIYAIQQGDTCNNLTNIANDVNIIIIAFWGRTSYKAIRINDLIAAMRLENYTKIGKCLQREKDELVPAIIERMNEGRNILRGTERTQLQYSYVHDLIETFGTSKSIYSFLKDAFFYIMETFNEEFRE